MKAHILSLFLVAFAVNTQVLEGAWVWEDGKFKNINKVATLSCQDHYAEACHAFEKEDWVTAESHFRIVQGTFPGSSFGQESSFFLGVCCYEMDELDLANEAFSEYLKSSAQPVHFVKTMEYKYRIANEFREGAMRRPFGSRQLPKWMPAENIAIQIYDEIIQCIPCHEIAAYSLWAKACMLRQECHYQDSIEAYQTLIRRFPKHELTPKAYLAINKVYLEESEWEFQNPDLLQLAEINYKKFKKEFPRDDYLTTAEADVQNLKEAYASGLWRTGKFYEWQGQCEAAVIYYLSAIKQFPDTQIAEQCKARLKVLKNDSL